MLKQSQVLLYSVADPYLELRGGGGGSVLDLLAMAAIFLSVISSLLTQNKGGGGGPGPPGPSPRFATGTCITGTSI